ncbi:MULTISPECIES: 4Fe-4S dicluster domain-containing protein [unclassified Helicobacter]|uniref:4Fe-4S dicluster domain-containing protein n=1 Tax=unclassified Helicobacter TaxID=2593540 RepID=UPI000CF11B11|nr:MULTISPECIES: (Fe-S)-binding protein [unclassified Helicobacter]
MSLSKEVSNACIKCAKCIPICPSYEVYRDEIHSPRGFLELIRQYYQGNLELNQDLQAILNSCSLCGDCVKKCPIDLPIDEAIRLLRAG